MHDKKWMKWNIKINKELLRICGIFIVLSQKKNKDKVFIFSIQEAIQSDFKGVTIN